MSKDWPGPHFTIVSENGMITDDDISLSWLQERSLYKTLSLVLSYRVGIHTLPSLLLCKADYGHLKEASAHWGWPIMIRMDFSVLPEAKNIGGIPIKSIETAMAVSEFLFSEKYQPLFHPHVDRFYDEYSAGLLYDPSKSGVVYAELVGKGFDAGDLRLGAAIPHEVARLNFENGAVEQLRVIDSENYAIGCFARNLRIEAMRRYVTFVNAEGRLSSTLDDADVLKYAPDELEPVLPPFYTPMPKSRWNQLLDIALILQGTVIKNLPPSKSFVASLSCVPNVGWILWDIYGSWYKR